MKLNFSGTFRLDAEDETSEAFISLDIYWLVLMYTVSFIPVSNISRVNL